MKTALIIVGVFWCINFFMLTVRLAVHIMLKNEEELKDKIMTHSVNNLRYCILFFFLWVTLFLIHIL